jgi:hypothetical protein
MTHPADGLQSGLRTAWSLCEKVRADLLAALRSVRPDDWGRPPASGRWSVSQQADHLLRSEIGTSKIVRRLIRGDFQGRTRPPGAVLYDSTLEVYPFPPAAAPAVLQPEGLAADEAHAQLAAAHARFFEELQRFTAGDPDALVGPDPASDLWFTLAGWVRVQALHEEHHLLQVRELAAGHADGAAAR